jgi:hypothetical protein
VMMKVLRVCSSASSYSCDMMPPLRKCPCVRVATVQVLLRIKLVLVAKLRPFPVLFPVDKAPPRSGRCSFIAPMPIFHPQASWPCRFGRHAAHSLLQCPALGRLRDHQIDHAAAPIERLIVRSAVGEIRLARYSDRPRRSAVS